MAAATRCLLRFSPLFLSFLLAPYIHRNVSDVFHPSTSVPRVSPPYSSRRQGIRVTLGRLVLISDRANDVPPGRISCLEYGSRYDARANVTKPPPLFYGNLFKRIRETPWALHELRISLETRWVHKISYLVSSMVEGDALHLGGMRLSVSSGLMVLFCCCWLEFGEV